MKLHDALGVSEDASPEDVTAAYRAKAKTAHPDAGGDPESFKTISNAYMVLRDPARRAHYEQTGDDGATGVDVIREGALAMLGQAVSQALVDPRAAVLDFVAIIRDNIKAQTGELQRSLKEIEARRALVGKNAARWKRKAKAGQDDIIAAMTAGALRDCERLKAQADQQIAIRAAALDIIDGYDYRHEAPAKAPANPWIAEMLNQPGQYTTTFR